MKIVLTNAVKETLELGGIDEKYLVGEISNGNHQEMEGRPGFYQSELLIAQYSPFDPETGVWRKVEVFLRKKGSKWEVYDLRGLKISGGRGASR